MLVSSISFIFADSRLLCLDFIEPAFLVYSFPAAFFLTIRVTTILPAVLIGYSNKGFSAAFADTYFAFGMQFIDRTFV